MDFDKIKAAILKRHAGAEHWDDQSIRSAWDGLAPDMQAEYVKDDNAGIRKDRNAKGLVARARDAVDDRASDAPMSSPDSAGVFREV